MKKATNYTNIMFRSAWDGDITRGLTYTDNADLISQISTILQRHNSPDAFVLFPFNCSYADINI